MGMKVVVVAALLLYSVSVGQAAEVPGIPNLHLGMSVQEAVPAFDFKEEMPLDPKMPQVLGIPYFPGYWHGAKNYTVDQFQFNVTIHIDEATKRVDFISLVQDFKDRSKVPDMTLIPAALTEKYGNPLKVRYNAGPGLGMQSRIFWWEPGSLIEAVIYEGTKENDPIFVPHAAVYYQVSDFTKNAQKAKSKLAEGL